MEDNHKLSLSTNEYEMLIRLVTAGGFVINAPYAPDEENFDKEIFNFEHKLVSQSSEKGLDIDIDQIIYETMDCINAGFLIQFAFQLATRDCVAAGYDAREIHNDQKTKKYHIERHNYYLELFAIKGIDALGIIE